MRRPGSAISPVLRKRALPVVILGLLIVLLASCGTSTDAEHVTALESGKPQVFLTVDRPEGWVLAASGMLLNSRPEFEINAVASSVNIPINRIEYRVNGGSWVQIPEVRQKIRLRPAAQLPRGEFPAGQHSLDVRVTDSSAASKLKTIAFTVDAKSPVWDAFTLDGADVLGLSDPAVAVLLGTGPARIRIHAEAVDDRDQDRITIMLLNELGEEVMSRPGPVFSSALDMLEIGEGSHVFTLVAADAVGNLSEALPFTITAAEESDDALPTVVISSPENGTALSAGGPLEVVLEIDEGKIGVDAVHVMLDNTELERQPGPAERFSGRVPAEPGTYSLVAWTVSGGTSSFIATDRIAVEVVDEVPTLQIVSPTADESTFGPGRAFDVQVEFGETAVSTLGWQLVGELEPLNSGQEPAVTELWQTGRNTLAGMAPTTGGRYKLNVWAQSPAADVLLRSAAATMDIWVDTTPPVVQIIGPAHGSTLHYTSSHNGPGSPPPLPPHDVELQFSDYTSPIDRIIVESNVAGGWVNVISLNADELEGSHTVTRKWNPQPGGNILRATAWDRFGNTSVSEIVPVFLTSDPDVGGPEVALALPASGQATVTRGEDFTFHFRLNTRFNQDGSLPGELLGEPEFWLNSELLNPTDVIRVLESDWGGTFAGSRERRYTWTIPADLEPGGHVLFIRVHGRSGGMNDSYGVRSLAIVLNVE